MMAHQVQKLSQRSNQLSAPDRNCPFACLYPGGQALHSFPEVGFGPALQRTFPDRGHTPARFQQRLNGPVVILDIAADLLAPERLSRRRPSEQMTVVPVPEAAVNEDNGLIPGKDKIRFPGQLFCMQPVAQPGRMKRFADQELRPGIPSFNSRHVAAAGRGVVNVHQTSGGLAPARRLCQCLDMRLHDQGDRFENRDGDRVSELLVGLRI